MNELTAFTTTNWVDPTFDAAGNMTKMPAAAVGDDPSWGRTLTYDAWNRLVEVRAESNGHLMQVNEYDGLHRRIVRNSYDKSSEDTWTGARRYYYNENWQCLEERIESSEGTEDTDPLAQYVHHPYYIDAIAVRYYDENTDGDLNDPNEGKHFYLQDANFNVTAIVDDTGTVVERYHYSPYGEVTVLDADFSTDADNKSDIGNEFLYTGRRLDPETGLQQYRYRYYGAEIGRFINHDPIEYADGYNLYCAYFVPNAVDPFGLRDTPGDMAITCG